VLDIINHTLGGVGVNNGYISHGQFSSHKAFFEIELGLLNFSNVNKKMYNQ
jgi:hypothetical protein